MTTRSSNRRCRSKGESFTCTSTGTERDRAVIVVSGGDLILLRASHQRRLAGHRCWTHRGDRVRRVDPAGATVVDASDCYVAPGFIDVHVHGLHGHDTLDGEGAIAHIAALMPRYGVTAFCPTTVACAPDDLRGVLQQVRQARVSPVAGSARVLPAHLESNFINPDTRGAASGLSATCGEDRVTASTRARHPRCDFGVPSRCRHRDDGPELPGGIDLVRSLAAAGHRVSLGHSGSDYETAIAAIEPALVMPRISSIA